ncbi:isoprenylcysteine carboxylmethyltransferase family protein [Actinomadura darangshiensis]|uniref:Isoprenylcysteine carboxylmethyltransferase family protein n=1 Tax=Actinomadura darangshiensis TaxID=705336 RepID=A0A4R5B9K7_9ACTN|nr:isoprenylcysteine carboxylmethyltransferase family protein [Actinomadura darangshiensis]TDD81246.1 isoprenylcysteine carboxylmethyltransferase family protein [Actinomadura darangshiensis]
MTSAMRLLMLAPRLLFIAGAGALTVGIVLHAGREGAAETVATGLLAGYLGWLLLEAPVTFRRTAAPAADGRTLLPYALARLLLVASASFGPLPWGRWSPWLLAPAAVFAAGVALRQAAIRTLGRFYSHHVMRQDGHRVVTGGLYGLVRHPAYAGMLLANAGFACFFLDPAGAAALALLASAVAWRIRVEERALWDVPGYAQYAAGKPRVLPKVW